MPDYVLSKGATPMNQHFKITMFTSKFCTDFALQNPFKVRSTQLDTTLVPIYRTFCFGETMHGKMDASF